MNSFAKAVKGAKHLVNHKEFADFSGSKVDASDAKYEEAACNFKKYADGIKPLLTTAKLFQQQFSTTFNKLIQVAECIEQVSLEMSASGLEMSGVVATKAARLLKMARMIRERNVTDFIQKFDDDFIKVITSQLEDAKKVKAGMTSRVESVATANHYNTKLENIRQQITANPSKAEKSQEKLERNQEKQIQSMKDLERETQDLLDHFKVFQDHKTDLMSSRTCWLRDSLQDFFGKARQEHETAFQDNKEDEAVDHSIRLSEAKRRESRSASMLDTVSNAKLSVGNWVKHKGQVFGARNSISEVESVTKEINANDEHYETCTANYRAQKKLLNDLCTQFNGYFRHIKSMAVSMVRIAEDIKALAETNDTALAEAANFVDQTHSSYDKMEQMMLGPVASMYCFSENKIREELETFSKIPKEIEERVKAALDAVHYSEKLKSLRIKTKQMDTSAKGYETLMEKVVRNEVKCESSRKELEDQTGEVLTQLSKFDGMCISVMQCSIDAFYTYQAEWLMQTAVQFGLETGTEKNPVVKKTFITQTDDSSALPSAPVPHEKERKSKLSHGHGSAMMSGVEDDELDGEFTDEFVNFENPASQHQKPKRLSEVRSRDSADLEEISHVQDEHLVIKNERRRSLELKLDETTLALDGIVCPDTTVNHETEKNMLEESSSAVQPAPVPSAPAAAEKPQLTPGMIYVRAKFEFQGVEDGDLPFTVGDIFQADEQEFEEHKDSSGWVRGVNVQGIEGVFPSNYVERLDADL